MKIRESVLAVLVAAVPLLAAANPSSGTPLPKPSVDVRAWPRMTSPKFGCYVETTFGYRDKRFNCALKKYRNTGDACGNTKAYYEGPVFPDRLAASVHPLATKVELDWEHGDLQMVTVTLKGTWNEADVRKAFGLPRAEARQLTDAELRSAPGNLMDTSVQYPSSALDESLAKRPSNPARGTTAVMLYGFDHMGAGDADCGGGE
ncbi:hypothetical protein WK39_15555 [Burkholderia cepacia]|uniref:hypothetical protein n=1 Tax=Burkholderia cepacia TaxID=292 RepID=UPI0007582975|nr:hypothetical protein [Burkholderia cepacia]KVS59930.1 hypothetical protein WK40_22495 [Burkholderia cepacia]KVS60892.1 hypothetical protein WK39_15555 [Burkholderia cepacia]RQT89608.1 hypothetical protein DF023_01880 [Burkholderia cepacia]RQU08533.1 hypothetical protein DF022_02105 [Burkholderia cepacia]RQZ84599.1 hypothetical protein DF056_01880 [Burkholderia cepacia]